MRLRIIQAVKDVLKEKFEKMLLAGDFPEVNYSKTGIWKSYNTMEYVITWTTFTALVDRLIKEKNMDSNLGIFTRKRSKAFINQLTTLVEGITKEMVYSQTERFKTAMWD